MEDEDNRRKRLTVRELWNNFAGYSTLHGLHFLVDAPSYLRKMVWFLLLCGAMSFFAFVAFRGWEKWRKNDVFITTEIKLNDVSVAFPAVTICNKNMMKKSKIIDTDSQRYLDALDPTLQYKWKTVYSQMNQSSFNIEQAVLKNGHQLDDMVKDCYSGELSPCKFNNSLNFQEGLCHTFNKDGSFKITKKGSSFGLYLLLDAEPEEYYGRFSRYGVGFSIMVHDQDFRPVPELDGWDVPTGFATNFILRRKEIIRQPAPYPSRCSEIKLQSNEVYSDHSCFFEKLTMKTAEKCGCRILGMSVIGERSKKFCNTEKINTCVFPLLYKANLDPKQCPPSCKTVQYDIQTSSLVFPSGDVLEKASNDIKEMYNSSKTKNISFHDWYRSRFALVKIFFYSTDTVVVREVPAYEFVDFIGGFGGNMGLLLGCSVLTLLEFVDFIVLVIIEWCRRKKCNSQTISASGQKRFSLQEKL